MAKQINFELAKDKLHDLAQAAQASTQNQNSAILAELRDDIVRALEAGATIKSIWLSLREAGFSGNAAAVSIWLNQEGIRPRTKKAPNGSGKKTGQIKSENNNLKTGKKQEENAKKTNNDNEKTEAGLIDITEDDYLR